MNANKWIPNEWTPNEWILNEWTPNKWMPINRKNAGFDAQKYKKLLTRINWRSFRRRNNYLSIQNHVVFDEMKYTLIEIKYNGIDFNRNEIQLNIMLNEFSTRADFEHSVNCDVH